MANEITVLKINEGGRSAQLLLLFPVAAPKQINGVNVVDRDPSSIPQVGGLSVLTTTERSAIMGGTVSFEVVDSYPFDPEVTNPQLVAAVRAFYAERLADFPAEYAARWRFTGSRVNAV